MIVKTASKKILSALVIFSVAFPSLSPSIVAAYDESAENGLFSRGVIGSSVNTNPAFSDDDIAKLKTQNVGFLVEGIDDDGNILRSKNGYPLSNFLSDTTSSAILDGKNGAFGPVALYTPSPGSVQEYKPVQFQWNVPWKKYEIDANGNRINSGDKILDNTTENNLCTYGLTAAANNGADMPVKVDVYGTTADGKGMIGKNVAASFFSTEQYYNDKANYLTNSAYKPLSDSGFAFLDPVNPNKVDIYSKVNFQNGVDNNLVPDGRANNGTFGRTNLLDLIPSTDDSKGSWVITDNAIDNGAAGSKNGNLIFHEEKPTNRQFGWKLATEGTTGTGGISLSKSLSFSMIKSGASTRYLDSNNNIILNAVSNEDLAESFSSDIFSKSVTTSYSDSVAQEFRKKILSYDPDTNPDSTDTDNIVTALYDMDSYIDTYTNTKGIQRVSSTLDSDSPLDDNAIATTQEERNSIVADWSDSIVSEFFSLTETHFSLLTKNADGGTVANIPKTADFPSLRKNFITSTKNVTGRIGFATFNPDATINTNDSFTDGGATPFFTPNFLDVDGKMYNVPFPVIVPKDIDSISENATARTDIYSAFNAVVYGDKYSVDTNGNKTLTQASSRQNLGLAPFVGRSKIGLRPVSFSFLHTSDIVQDFYDQYANLRPKGVDFVKDFLKFIPFQDGGEYLIDHSVTLAGSNGVNVKKTVTKNPYAYPVTYISSDTSRSYKDNSTTTDLRISLNDATRFKSGFKMCLSDPDLGNMYKATPESNVYTQKVSSDGKTYLVTYKVLQMQYKYLADMSFGSDMNIFGDIPQSNLAVFTSFMNNDPLQDAGNGVKVENFLSASAMPGTPGFSLWQSSTSKRNLSVRYFIPSNSNTIRYSESGGGHDDANPSDVSHPIFKTQMREFPEGYSYSDASQNNNGSILVLGRPDDSKPGQDVKVNKFATEKTSLANSDVYEAPTCPKNYYLWDNWKQAYQNLYSGTGTSANLLRAINGIGGQQGTSFFNVPRPFCVHNSYPDSMSADDVLGLLNKEFFSSPFGYYIGGVYTISPVYMKTLQSLFVGEKNQHPVYNNVDKRVVSDLVSRDSNLSGAYGYRKITDIPDAHKNDFGIDEFIQTLFFPNSVERDGGDLQAKATYEEKVVQAKRLFSSAPGTFYGPDLGLTAWSDDDSAAGAGVLHDFFPIIGATIQVKNGQSADFGCFNTPSDANAAPTNSDRSADSTILFGQCIDKTISGTNGQGDRVANQKVAVVSYRGTENNTEQYYRYVSFDGAFVNNMVLIPYFKSDWKTGEYFPQFAETSGNLYVQSDATQFYPFITNPIKPNLAPTSAALGTFVSDPNADQRQVYEGGLGIRAGGYFYPYKKFSSALSNNTERIKNFNNLLLNASAIGTKYPENIGDSGEKVIEYPYASADNYDPFGNRGFQVPTFDASPFDTAHMPKVVDGPGIYIAQADTSVTADPTASGATNNGQGFAGAFRNSDAEISYGNTMVLSHLAQIYGGKPNANIYIGDNTNNEYGVDGVYEQNFAGYKKDDHEQDKNFSEHTLPSGRLYMLQAYNTNVANGGFGGGMTLNAISYYITAEYADSQCMFSHDLGTNSCTIPYENFPARGSNPSDGGVSESTDPSELAATGTVLPSNLSKNRFFDGYSYNQLLDKDTGNSLSIGSDYERGTATPLTSNGNGMCTYVGSTDGTDCTPGRLSFSPTIESRFGLFGNALASLFPTFFAPGGGSGVTAIAMSNNARFDGLHQDDAVLLTNGNQNIKDVNGNDTTVTLEGGYIDPITNGYADPTSGLLKKQYIFSDWDNTNTNSFRMDYQNYNIGPTQEDRQAQRASIKNEIAKSAASLDTGTDPSKGVKFVSWTISKDDFRSLNGILRLGKNSLSEWTNLKIVDPNTGKLLSETKPEESIYSWNNLVVKYGDKYYTWGDHDTSCNGINPWKTFKGLNDTSSMDSQGMTICLSNGGISGKNDLSADVSVILPIKPTKKYASVSSAGSETNDSLLSSLNSNGSKPLAGMGEKQDSNLYSVSGIGYPLQSFSQGYFSQDGGNGYFTQNVNPGTNGTVSGTQKMTKGRSVGYYANFRTYGCGSWTNPRTCYSASANYNESNTTSFNSNTVTISKIPKIFINGFLAKADKNKTVSLKTNIVTGKNNYSVYFTRPMSSGSYSRASSSSSIYNDMLRFLAQMGTHYQEEIKLSSSVNPTTKLVEIPAQTVFPILPVPEAKISDYSGVQYSPMLSDTYKKAGNSYTSASPLASSDDYIEGSLKEGGNKVAIGDVLEFSHTIKVPASGVVPQTAYIKTTIDPGLDLDVNSLTLERQGSNGRSVKQPIYEQSTTTTDQTRIANDTVFSVTDSFGKGNEESLKSRIDSNSANISLSDKGRLSVRSGVLYAKAVGVSKIEGNGSLSIWNGQDPIETVVGNGLVKSESTRDTFTSSQETLTDGQIVILRAGSSIRSVGATTFTLVPYSSIPAALLNFSFNTILQDQKNPIIGVDRIGDVAMKSYGSSVGGYYTGSTSITYSLQPNATQPTYSFLCSQLESQDSFEKFIPKIDVGLDPKYCTVENKYSTTAFEGLIGSIEPYSHLAMPSESSPFMLVRNFKDRKNLISGIASQVGNGNRTLTNSPIGRFSTDSENLLIANVGKLLPGEIITVRYEARVNRSNDIGHVLFAQGYKKSVTEENGFDGYFFDGKQTVATTDDTNIYSHATEATAFFLNHRGEEVPLSGGRKPYQIEGQSYLPTAKITTVPDIDVSYRDLSGRKQDLSCDSKTAVSGNCDPLLSLERANRDDVSARNTNGLAEPEVAAYKGQKFIVRLDVTDKYLDRTSADDILFSGKAKVLFDSNNFIFDSVAYEKTKMEDQSSSGPFKLGSSTHYDLGYGKGIGKSIIGESNFTVHASSADEKLKLSIKASKGTWDRSGDLSGMMTLEYPIDVATLKTNGHITLEFLFTAKTTKNAGNISGQFESSYISNERSIITAYGEFSKTKSTEKMYALDSENRSFQDILSQNALSLNGASGNFSSTTKTIDTGTNITTSPNFLFVIVPFSADYQFAGKKVTDLDPSVASISARIVNSNTGTVAGAISSTSTSGNSLYAEIVNTSTTPIELVEGSVSFALPSGFTPDSGQPFTTIESVTDGISTGMKKMSYSVDPTNTVSFPSNQDGRRVYIMKNPKKTLAPGDKWAFSLNIAVDLNSAEIVSNFTVSATVTKNNIPRTLFSDTSTNVGASDMTTRSLPLWSENDAYVGWGAEKNTTNSTDYVESRLGASSFNVLGGNGNTVDYVGSKIRKSTLTDFLRPGIFDATENLDPNSSYTVHKDEYVDGWQDKGSYALLASSTTLQNNTLYYFTKDVMIGDVSVPIGTPVTLTLKSNNSKVNGGGVTIFSEGKLSILSNIVIPKSGKMDTNMIPNFALIAESTEIHPRVTSIAGYYINPLARSSIVHTDGSTVSATGDSGLFRAGFSNDPLAIFGNVISGKILTERSVSAGITSTDATKNGVENVSFDLGLSANPPPILRKK